MNRTAVARELVEVARLLTGATGTFECPECGTKVLENTGYCVKCKKKVKKAAKWESLPRGWTESSLGSFYKSLAGAGDAKAKFYRCVDKMGGSDVTDPNAFCGALLDRFLDPSWRGVGRQGIMATMKKAGFEKHLDFKMESLGYGFDDYEFASTGPRPTVRMPRLSDSELREVARKLVPDFNATVRGGLLVFQPVKQLWMAREAAGGFDRVPLGAGFNAIVYPDGMVGVFRGTTSMLFLERPQARALAGLLRDL